MGLIETIAATRHPYADGSYKQMLIDGKWVDAASGKRFQTHNPATGELLATVAEGDAEDINRAVAAARRAFEGPWSKVKPYERQGVLLKLADLVERHFDELSMLDTLDMGARRSAAPAAPSGGCWACCDITPGKRRRCTARPSRIRCRAISSPTR
jgi:aldehyde dehydrogenase (NAD+)